jgi:PAS domain S-box-containing protein
MAILPNSETTLKGARRKAAKDPPGPEQKLRFANPGALSRALEELQIQSTELEIQNEELAESRAQGEALQARYFRHFDPAPVGMIRLDKEGIILEANILAATMLGVNRARLHRRKFVFAMRLTPDSQSVFQAHFKRALGSFETESCEISLRRKTGAETFVRMQSIASRGAEGATDLFASLTDLTDHHRAEVQRLALEHRLLDRQKLENIGTLAGGIAHDLNNILQVINSSLDMGKEEAGSNPALLKHLAVARQAGDRATNLSRRLLTFSKGGSPIKQLVSLREILGSSVAFWLSGSNLQLDLSLPPDLLRVSVDAVQFAQVIENVVMNAREASPNGGRLAVRASNVPARRAKGTSEGPWVQIEIADEGSGIPEEIREKIFDVCFTTKPGGNGIGLATAKSIVEQHDGQIAVQSVLGRGTTISLLFPAVEHPFPPAAPARAETPAKGSGRILVIDDEEMILDVVPSMLKGLGYGCTVASDGVAGCEAYARAMAENRPFAAVLLDATIPGGLGGEAALQLLLQADPKARVILFSGYADSDVMMRAEELGFKGRLAKPFSIPELAAAFHGVLS